MASASYIFRTIAGASSSLITHSWVFWQTRQPLQKRMSFPLNGHLLHLIASLLSASDKLIGQRLRITPRPETGRNHKHFLHKNQSLPNQPLIYT